MGENQILKPITDMREDLLSSGCGRRLLVYFDTNVFGHLLKKKTHGITERHETRLRAAIKSGTLSVLVGLHAIDETAANPRDPVPELRLIWELCDWDRIVKPADILLADDIRHFAYNGEPSHPFVDVAVRNGLWKGMQGLLEDPSKLANLRNLVGEYPAAAKTISAERPGTKA